MFSVLKSWVSFNPENLQDEKNIEKDLPLLDAEPIKSTLPEVATYDEDYLNHQIDEDLNKAYETAVNLTTYVQSLGKSAAKIVTKSVSDTAKSLADTINENALDEISTPVNKESNNHFSGSQNILTVASGVRVYLSWRMEEEEFTCDKNIGLFIRQIMNLSRDENNFLTPPTIDELTPEESQFDMEAFQPLALALLREDANLDNIRFCLVPGKIKEERFWRNYYHRIMLLKRAVFTHLQCAHTNDFDAKEGAETENQLKMPESDSNHDDITSNADSYDCMSDIVSGNKGENQEDLYEVLSVESDNSIQ